MKNPSFDYIWMGFNLLTFLDEKTSHTLSFSNANIKLFTKRNHAEVA